MNVSEEQVNDTLILAPVGRLDSTTSPEFEKLLLPKVDGASARVILDLGQLDYISSAGLRVVLMAAKRAKQSSGSFALCGLQENVREVFEISGFLSILTVCGTRDEALAAVTA